MITFSVPKFLMATQSLCQESGSLLWDNLYDKGLITKSEKSFLTVTSIATVGTYLPYLLLESYIRGLNLWLNLLGRYSTPDFNSKFSFRRIFKHNKRIAYEVGLRAIVKKTCVFSWDVGTIHKDGHALATFPFVWHSLQPLFCYVDGDIIDAHCSSVSIWFMQELQRIRDCSIICMYVCLCVLLLLLTMARL